MATVTFYLNKNKADKKGRYPIILQCDHNKQRFKYFTGEKIDPKYWSKSKNSYIKPSYNDDSTLDNYGSNIHTVGYGKGITVKEAKNV